MKKIVLALLFCILLTTFAFGSNDYPVIMNNGTVFLNGGIGFRNGIDGDRLTPPLTMSLDTALPIMGYPLSIGFITGYFSEEGFLNSQDQANRVKKHFDYWPLAMRIAYHADIFDIPRLDTYLLVTVGGISRYIKEQKDTTHFWFGVCAGARYFFLPRFGAYVELGLDKIQLLSFGFSLLF